MQIHCQKYFIKLTKAGLPIPSRMPNLKTYVTKKGNRMVLQLKFLYITVYSLEWHLLFSSSSLSSSWRVVQLFLLMFLFLEPDRRKWKIDVILEKLMIDAIWSMYCIRSFCDAVFSALSTAPITQNQSSFRNMKGANVKCKCFLPFRVRSHKVHRVPWTWCYCKACWQRANCARFCSNVFAHKTKRWRMSLAKNQIKSKINKLLWLFLNSY